MAKSRDVRELVASFVAELEAAIESRVNGNVADKFEKLKAEILGGRAPRGASSVATKPSRPGRKPPNKADMKPCPLSGTMNAGRRFSYLMPEYRTPENLKKFRGWHRKTDEEKAALGVIPAAIRATSSDAKPSSAAPKARGKKKAGKSKKG